MIQASKIGKIVLILFFFAIGVAIYQVAKFEYVKAAHDKELIIKHTDLQARRYTTLLTSVAYPVKADHDPATHYSKVYPVFKESTEFINSIPSYCKDDVDVITLIKVMGIIPFSGRMELQIAQESTHPNE